MRKTKERIKCANCKFSRIQADPDPDEPLFDSDEKIYCIKLERYVARGIAPYEVDKFRCSGCPLE